MREDHIPLAALGLVGLLCLVSIIVVPKRMVHEETWEDQAIASPGQHLSSTLLFGGQLDLNAASAHDLAALPNIGPNRAQHIVALRIARGRFEHVDELLDVPGIGPKTLEGMRPFVVIVRGK